MADDRDIEDIEADLVVFRREGCICVRASSPYSGDVQALLREWDYKYKGGSRISYKLAKAWNCLFVVCPSFGEELDALRDYENSDTDGLVHEEKTPGRTPANAAGGDATIG